MIGRLRGRIADKGAGQILLDVGGVGYIVHCSDRTIAALPSVGQEGVVFTELIVREDLLQLVGFASAVEREWYGLLVSVQGVGARAALAILGTIGTTQLARALTLGDAKTVQAAPGIGPKLALRITNELADRAAKLMGRIGTDEGAVIDLDDFASQRHPEVEPIAFVSAPASITAEAISALVNLGYDRVQAAQTVGRLAEGTSDLNTLITASLRQLAPKG